MAGGRAVKKSDAPKPKPKPGVKIKTKKNAGTNAAWGT